MAREEDFVQYRGESSDIFDSGNKIRIIKNFKHDYSISSKCNYIAN